MKAIRHSEVISRLSSLGLELVRQGKGSHAIYKLNDKTACIPNHKELSPGTLRDILKCLQLDKNLFNDIRS